MIPFIKKKKSVTFHMKSGAALTFKCDNLTTKTNSMNELISYSMVGLVGGTAHYIRLDDVLAIEVKK
jgi:hypothetical protein